MPVNLSSCCWRGQGVSAFVKDEGRLELEINFAPHNDNNKDSQYYELHYKLL